VRKLLGRAVSDNVLLKKAVETMSGKKIQCVLSLIQEGHPIKAVGFQGTWFGALKS